MKEEIEEEPHGEERLKRHTTFCFLFLCQPNAFMEKTLGGTY